MSHYQKIILIIALCLGTLVQVTPVIRSGLTYSYGIGFWGPSGHDSVWHLSLINNIRHPLNISMPIFAGEKLVNYHPFFDILINFLTQTTHLPSSLWLFQIFPIFSSLILLSLSFYFGRLITQRFSGGLILLGLNSLANSFGWIVTLIRSGNLGGESLFWAMQSPSNQINPPFNLSLIFILIILILIFRHLHHYRFSATETAIIFITLILLPITKAYAAIVGFSFYGLYSLKAFINTRQFYHPLVFICSLITAVFIFRLYNPQSQSLLVWHPFWFINSLIDSPDKLFIPKVSSLRFTLESTRSPDIRLPLVYLFSLGAFIIGNFGFRILGIFSLRRLPRFINFVLLLNIFILTLIPILFIQQGTSWNTIQFLYYALFIANIFLTLFLINRPILTSLIFFTFLLSFWGTLPNYLGGNPPTALPSEEIKALQFLQNLPPGTVLTAPYDPYFKHEFSTTPIPLYAYETTAYVSAYSYHHTYLEDEMNLNNSGYDFNHRRQSSLEFFSQKHPFADRGFLLNNQIDYIYLTGLQINRFPLNLESLSLKTVYHQDNTIIYQVRR